jgi:cytochrome c-type biogenesis protein CcmH/NrfG
VERRIRTDQRQRGTRAAGAGRNRPILAARLAVLAVALAACAWFALGAVQVHDQSRAAALIPDRNTLTETQANRIFHLLDRAGTLNPDRNIDILRAETYLHTGDAAAAEREMLRVVRAEPMNIEAWFLLEIASAPVDRATERLAIAKQRELAPPVPAAR